MCSGAKNELVQSVRVNVGHKHCADVGRDAQDGHAMETDGRARTRLDHAEHIAAPFCRSNRHKVLALVQDISDVDSDDLGREGE
jgi:hypothetical protein